MFVKILKYFLIMVAVFALAIVGFFKLSPVFGGHADNVTLSHMAKMKTFNNGIFENLEPIIVDGSGAGVAEEDRLHVGNFLMNIFNPADGKHPKQPLPTLPLKDNLPTQNNSFTWLGHSSVIFKMSDKVLMTDPVFYRVSPIPMGGSPYAMTNLPKTADLPNIDIVIISHDHYDHLDMKAIKEIHERVGKFLVPLGVKAHLLKWGVPESKISEFAWYDHQDVDGLSFDYVPARHYGGRSFGTRNTSLWGGWVIKADDFALYYTGDSGYGSHFTDVGEKYAPEDGFDLILVENGAYNVNWADVHMFPEQSVQAVKDARGKVALPVHWGKYDLAYHAWNEPAQRFYTEAQKQNINILTPQIGQNIRIGDETHDWWTAVKYSGSNE